MAKKKKHLRTDRRSVERRKARDEQKRLINEARKAGLLGAGFHPQKENQLILKALEGGHGYRPSLKKLTKAFNKARAEERQAAMKFVVQQQKIKNAFKTAEEIGKKNTARVQREKDFAKKYAEFRQYYYEHPPVNTQNHRFFAPGEIPFYNPQSDAEIERDYANIKKLQAILDNPNKEQAKHQYYEWRNKIITEAGGLKAFNEDTIPIHKLTLRGITKQRDNTEYTAWLNYLGAAEAAGLDIFADALREGGVQFATWLYRTVAFDWKDYYQDENVKVSESVADKRIFEMARAYQDNASFGKILRKMIDRYHKRYGWVGTKPKK